MAAGASECVIMQGDTCSSYSVALLGLAAMGLDVWTDIIQRFLWKQRPVCCILHGTQCMIR